MVLIHKPAWRDWPAAPQILADRRGVWIDRGG
jgi:hypothetical protein